MTDTPNRPPLWEAMDRADRNIKLSVEQSDWPRYIKAAEIRALRDWLVPEEAPPLGPAGKAHMVLRALLTAEADRAERGDA